MVTVKNIMTKKVVTVSENTTIQKTSSVLMRYCLSGVPVIDRKKNIIGFISERDIIAAVEKKRFYG